MTETYNVDCMEYMKTLPDKAFDLAVVDPPYGGGSQNVKVERETGLRGGAADFERRPLLYRLAKVEYPVRRLLNGTGRIRLDFIQ